MRLRRLVFGLGLLLSVQHAGAVSAAPIYRLPLNGTLPQNTVSTMMQDREGQLWFGTLGGLSVYDGIAFHAISSDPRDPNSLSGVHVSRLHQDRRGMIWIAGYQGWLNRIDSSSGRITHYPRTPFIRDGAAITGASAFYEAADGTLWLGTVAGLFRYDAATDAFLAEPLASFDKTPAVRDIAAAGDSALWLATGSGLVHYEPQGGNVRVIRHDPADARSLTSDAITALALDQQGRLWVGTPFGLNRRDVDGDSFERYRHVPGDSRSLGSDVVISLYQDPEGPLWVATQSGGLNRYVPVSNDFEVLQHDPDNPGSLATNDIWSVLRDASGLLWIGTAGSGLNQINPSRHRFESLRAIPYNSNSLRSPFVWDIQEDAAGHIWFATLAGLERYEPAARRFTLYQPRPGSVTDNQLQSLYIDGTGRIWAGTVNGYLYHFDPATGQFRRMRNPVTGDEHFSSGRIWYLGGDGMGRVWISHGVGLVALEESTLEVYLDLRAGVDIPMGRGAGVQGTDGYPVGMNERDVDPVRSMLVDSSGFIWFGGGGLGLSRYSPTTGEWISMRREPTVPDSLSHDVVRALHEDADGGLWVGTLNGLNHLSPEDRLAGRNRFRLYTQNDGLPNNTVYGILPGRDGELWISTNSGLSRFDPATGRFSHFDAADGLPSNEMNGGAELRARDGTLYFGGVGGAVHFNPRELPFNDYQPQVRITSVEVGGEPLSRPGTMPPSAPLELSWNQDDLSVKFATMDFHQPEKNRFRYRLAGYSDKWTETDKNLVSFVKLSPGRYRFEVLGSNNDGVWSERASHLDFALAPPFWRSGAAYVFYLLLLLGSAAWYHLAQTRKLAREREFSEQLSRAHSLAEANHKLAQRNARFDALTQLPNRASLLEHMAQHMRCARNEGKRLAVLVVNLDGFQHVNDSLGHLAGDRVLKTCAKRLASVAGQEDFVARLSGDEFAMLSVLPAGTRTIEWLSDHAQQVHQALGVPLNIDDPPLRLSATVGCAIYDGSNERPSDLLCHADAAMHSAKRDARGSLRFYDPVMTSAARERINLRGQVQRAIEASEFSVQYQPVVGMRSGRLVAFEALLRWSPPGASPIRPDQFIPVVEETGQIVEIGCWVIDETCRQMAAWREMGARDLTVAVNVSMKQLQAGGLAAAIDDSLRRHGVAAAGLKLEITESAMVENVADTAEQLIALKELGVTISVDDFGTGFSSLAHLKMLPVDEIKIDRSFVTDIANNDYSRKIVQSIIRLGHELDLAIVAEGIEDEQAAVYLAKAGCDMGQGYWYSPPRSPREDVLWDWISGDHDRARLKEKMV